MPKTNSTVASWPFDKPVPSDHTVINLADGIDLVCGPELDAEAIADARQLAEKFRTRSEVQS